MIDCNKINEQQKQNTYIPFKMEKMDEQTEDEAEKTATEIKMHKFASNFTSDWNRRSKMNYKNANTVVFVKKKKFHNKVNN